MRSLVFLAVVLICDCLFAQQVTVTRERMLSGGTVKQVGDRVFVGSGESKFENVGLIDVGKIPEKPQSLKVIVSNSKRELLQTERISNSHWIVRGSGKIWVDVRVLDLPTAFFLDEQVDGFELSPEPDPGPGPGPKPDPKPDPVPDLPNEYNLGLVALREAPKDPDLAKQIATLYRYGADQLFGRPSLKDIFSIRKEINSKFAARQCRDKPTCEHWDRWKNSVELAVTAEQLRRGTFSREDWYKALREIATALEAVR